jgi:hypothetical protein
MMTRKDYVQTAEILNDLYRFSDASDDQIENTVLAFADMFEADNPRFMRKVFFDACYKEGN